MKSTILSPLVQTVNPITFPILAKYKTANFTVLFTTEKTGTVVHTDGVAHQLGLCNHWRGFPEDWGILPPETKIVLSND
jgi:hypothetical protein